MDNDLMARRLRPPSEPPRPHNGHSPLPTEPDWSPIPKLADEIPWDKPAADPWPPTVAQPSTAALDAPPAAASSPTAPPPIVVQDTMPEPEPHDPWADWPASKWGDDPVDVDASAAVAEVTPAEAVSTEVPPVGWDAPDAFGWTAQAPWDAPEESHNGVATWPDASLDVSEAVAETEVADEPLDVDDATAEATAEPTAEPEAYWFETTDQEPERAEMTAVETVESENTDEATTDDHDGEEPDYLPMAAMTAMPWADLDANEQPELAPWDSLPDADYDFEATDMTVAGGAPWDRPKANDAHDVETSDAESVDAPASHDEMYPVVSRAVAAATAQQAVADPDDALAPVLNDVPQTPVASWPEWNAPAEAVDRAPVVPSSLDSGVGPTPPDDLFAPADEDGDEPAADAEEPAAEQASDDVELEAEEPDAEEPDAEVAAEASEPDAEVAADASEPDAEAAAAVNEAEPATAHRSGPMTQTVTVATPMPSLYSTAPNGPQQPLLLRIELAIVDDQIEVRTADAARRVGPWSDADAEAGSVTPRHPEFEPRPTVAATSDDEDATVNQVAPHAAAAAAAVEPAAPAQQEHDPWAAAEAASWTDGSTPWSTQPDPTQQEHDPWAVPDVSTDTSHDADATPMAASAPVPDDVSDFDWGRVGSSAEVAVAAQVGSEPALASAAPAASAVALQSAAATKASSADQSDLWFLASETDKDTTASDAAAQAVSQPSTLQTAGLTVVMAIVVVVLVVVFFALMTSLLR